MKEQLISFETAKLAKEKGFDEICLNYFYSDSTSSGNICESKFEIRNSTEHRFIFIKVECTAPTQSLLQKWLRENHGIHINIDFGLQWGYQLIPVGWYGEKFSENFIDGKDWLSYEQALENGLLQALKLIK